MAAEFSKSEPNWKRSLILICEKCGKKVGDDKLAQNLKNEWKKNFQESGQWGESRIVVSSCLDICPNGEIAVARIGNEKEVYTFKPDDAAEFLRFLKETESNAT